MLLSRALPVGRPRTNNPASRSRKQSQTTNDPRPDGWQGAFRTLGPNDPDGWNRTFYEIQEIIAYRTALGKDQYLVAWSDLPQAAHTWEPEANLTPDPNWTDLLQAYHDEQQRKNQVCSPLKQVASNRRLSFSLALNCNMHGLRPNAFRCPVFLDILSRLAVPAATVTFSVNS